jgi:hypothetical protein
MRQQHPQREHQQQPAGTQPRRPRQQPTSQTVLVVYPNGQIALAARQTSPAGRRRIYTHVFTEFSSWPAALEYAARTTKPLHVAAL